MIELNENIEIAAIEDVAESRILLINKQKESKGCLTIVLDENGIEIQDELYPIDNVTGFNAFRELLFEEEKENAMLLLLRKLSDENIDKINSLLS